MGEAIQVSLQSKGTTAYSAVQLTHHEVSGKSIWGLCSTSYIHISRQRDEEPKAGKGKHQGTLQVKSMHEESKVKKSASDM